MYLRKVTYQFGVRLKSLIPRFHKAHLENLALLVIGIAYSRSVSLPKAASATPYRRIQIESRVERFGGCRSSCDLLSVWRQKV